MQLLILAIPFGLISLLINIYRERETPIPSPHQIACMPFSSVTQIRSLWQQTPAFSKQGYREGIEERSIRSNTMNLFGTSLFYGYWILLGPLALFMQGLPS